MKLIIYKSIFKGTNFFFVLLLIDYITTLFSLNETKIVVSKLGIIFNHVETDTHIITQFGVDIKMPIIYIAVLVITFLLELWFNKKDAVSTN